MQNVQVLFGKLNARFSSSFCIIWIYFEQNISTLKYENYKIMAWNQHQLKSLTHGFSSPSIHATGQKKKEQHNKCVATLRDWDWRR